MMIDDAKSNSKLMITLQDKAARKLPLSDFDFIAADFLSVLPTQTISKKRIKY